MAFLDNSGDIILDAVLTDLGRKRLSEGKFNIFKFALGDEEINYQLWDVTKNYNSDYDLEILQTPVLEAFTSNESLMKSKLLSFARTNILYMPVMKLNSKFDGVKPNATTGGFLLMADRNTIKCNEGQKAEPGYLPGIYKEEDEGRFETKCVNVDQGIDNSDDGRTVLHTMDPSFKETAYLIKMDHRLLRMQVPQSIKNYNTFSPMMREQYLDDDFIATYYVSRGVGGVPIVEPDNKFFRARGLISDRSTESTTEIEAYEMFQGPLGRVLQFVPRVSNEVQFSDSFFTKLGTSGTNLTYRGQTISSYKYIDTTVNVQGMTTGYSIDIPIRIIKKS